MKKIFKKSNIFSFLLGAIIFGSVVGVSAYSIFATDIEYTPKDITWNVDNVESALDDLYIKAKTYKKLDTQTTANSNYILDGYTAYDNNGNLITGNMSTSMELLWTNPNPNAAFAIQTISIDLSEYKYVVINATYGGNGLLNDYFVGNKTIIEVGTTGTITGVYHSVDGGASTVRKAIVNTSGIQFGIGKFYNGSNQQSNNYAVPLNIWGIR